MSAKSKTQEHKGKTIEEMKAEISKRFSYENMLNVIKAFDELKHAIWKCYNGKTDIVTILRTEAEGPISDAWYGFIKAAKEEGVWQKFVEEKNKELLDFIQDEFRQVGNVFVNGYGDEISYNPVTGLLEQTAWGF